MREIRIYSQNYNGEDVTVVFYSSSNPSFGNNLGNFVVPFTYSAESVQGTYEITIPKYNKTCELSVS
jgi:hypothetical protein